MVFWQLTVDAQEPEALARFWALALGYRAAPGDGSETTWDTHYRRRLGADEAFTDRLFDPEGRRPPLWFQRSTSDRTGTNRLHLDVYVTGRDDALTMAERVRLVDGRVDELLAAGGTVERRTRSDDPEDPFYYVVMLDPEGNVFCVA